MEVLPVRSGAEAPWRHRRWLPVELAHRRSDRTEILRSVLHAGSLDQLKPADLALRKGHASRDDAPARVLDHQRGVVDRRMSRPDRQDSGHERRRRGGAQPHRFGDSQRARRRSLQPRASRAIASTIGISGVGSGGAPVVASCVVDGVGVGVDAGVGVGVGVDTGGHVDGIAPSVRFTGRCFEARATSACVVDKASGFAVADELGLEKPNPPFSNWNVSRSVTAFFPASVQAGPVGSSPTTSNAWMTAASEFGSESPGRLYGVEYSNPPLGFWCRLKYRSAFSLAVASRASAELSAINTSAVVLVSEPKPAWNSQPPSACC